MNTVGASLPDLLNLSLSGIPLPVIPLPNLGVRLQVLVWVGEGDITASAGLVPVEREFLHYPLATLAHRPPWARPRGTRASAR